MHFAHRTDRAGLKVLAQEPRTFGGLSPIAHLRGRAAAARLFGEQTHLGEGVCQQLLQIHVDAFAHGHQRRQRMVVRGRGDDHRVQLSPISANSVR